MPRKAFQLRNLIGQEPSMNSKREEAKCLALEMPCLELRTYRWRQSNWLTSQISKMEEQELSRRRKRSGKNSTSELQRVSLLLKRKKQMMGR